jgi:transposase
MAVMVAKDDEVKRTAREQERVRWSVIEAIIDQGMSKAQAARKFAVSRASIYNWLQAVKQEGLDGLNGRTRGPKGGRLLPPEKVVVVKRLLASGCPERLGLPGAVWTAGAVRALITRDCGLRLSVSTVGRYLTRWGLMPWRLLARGYDHSRKEMKRWMKRDYPAVRSAATAGKAAILWVDETWEDFGDWPLPEEIAGQSRFDGLMVFSAVTNRWQRYFMFASRPLTVQSLVEFLERLLAEVKTNVVLILDRHPAHKTAALKQWAASRKGQVQIVRLPWHLRRAEPGEAERVAAEKEERRKKAQREWLDWGSKRSGRKAKAEPAVQEEPAQGKKGESIGLVRRAMAKRFRSDL